MPMVSRSLRLVMDNYAAHKHKNVRDRLEQNRGSRSTSRRTARG